MDISGGKKEPWERCGGGGRAGQATGRWKVLTIDVRASRGCCEYFDSTLVLISIDNLCGQAGGAVDTLILFRPPIFSWPAVREREQVY